MSGALILNPAQAEAVYSAMCAVDKVGGRVLAFVPLGGGFGSTVRERSTGSVLVEGEYSGMGAGGGLQTERYDSRDAFAAAYGLQKEVGA